MSWPTDNESWDPELASAPVARAVRSARLADWQDSARRFSIALRQNLACGLRLALLFPRRACSWNVSVGQLLAQIAIDLLLVLTLDVLVAGIDGRFNAVGLPAALFYVPLVLLAGHVLSRIARSPDLTLKFPIALIAARQYVSLACIALYLSAQIGDLDISSQPGSFIYYYGPSGWWALIACVGAWSLTRSRTMLKLALSAIVVALVIAPGWSLHRLRIGPIWQESYDAQSAQRDESRYYAVTSENALYAQPDLLRRELDALKPGVAGAEQMYFVGVAGDADEDVFLKEITVISRLFEDRFGTAGRSVSLVNNRGTPLNTPIATVTSLQKTLMQVGTVMNRDEDVLFLYLTSHGSSDHELSLSFWPLQLRDLDPPALRQMLDVSGIRWRVIVVSACYSGGFIDALKDERTLIVTAADATHTSFGCGAESDFTYFGKAYFDQALRQTQSFTEAYEMARRTSRTRAGRRQDAVESADVDRCANERQAR